MFFRTDDRCNLVLVQAPSMEFLQTLRRRRHTQQHAYWPVESRGMHVPFSGQLLGLCTRLTRPMPMYGQHVQVSAKCQCAGESNG